MLSEKDLIAINNKFSNGNVMNKNSLKYAVSQVKRTNSWIKQAAYLTRAILCDHLFENGNKRSTAVVIIYYLDENGYDYNTDNINKLIIKIIKQNIININKIERLIENVIK